jgi:hypothetical protein
MDWAIPRTKPAANDTWGIQVQLDGDSEISETVPLLFPCPVMIVGCRPSVILAESLGSFLAPDTDNIMLNLQANQQRKYTNTTSQSSSAQRGNGYITLSSMDSDHRDVMIELDNARPEIQAQFKWKRFTQGTQIFAGAIINLDFFVIIKD